MRLHISSIILVSLLTLFITPAQSAPGYAYAPEARDIKKQVVKTDNIISTSPSNKLRLANLRGAQINDAVILQWTNNEKDANTYIVVERSTDGSSFTAITSIASRSSHQAYTDPNPPKIALYRLRFTAENGAVEYTVPVTCGEELTGMLGNSQMPGEAGQ